MMGSLLNFERMSITVSLPRDAMTPYARIVVEPPKAPAHYTHLTRRNRMARQSLRPVVPPRPASGPHSAISSPRVVPMQQSCCH